MRRALGRQRSVRRAQRGLSTVEYVILLVLVGTIAIGAWRVFGSRVQTALKGADNQFGDLLASSLTEGATSPGSGPSSAPGANSLPGVSPAPSSGSRPGSSTAQGPNGVPGSGTPSSGSAALRGATTRVPPVTTPVASGTASVAPRTAAASAPSPAASKPATSASAAPAPPAAAVPSPAAAPPVAAHPSAPPAPAPGLIDRARNAVQNARDFVTKSGPAQMALGVATGTLQAILPAGFLLPSPLPHSREFEAGRGAAQVVTGGVQVFTGGTMVAAGGTAAGAGGVGAPITGGTTLVVSAAGVGVAVEGLAVATQGATNVAAGIDTLRGAFNMSSSSSSGGGSSPKPPAKSSGVEMTDARGNPLGEFDHVEPGKFVEDKSAQGLNTPNPRTGVPQQTPDQWAQKQIFDKTEVRIDNLLNKATKTRPTPSGSPTVPSLDQIKGIRQLEFRVEASTPEVKAAVENQLNALRAQHPDWTFTATYGP